MTVSTLDVPLKPRPSLFSRLAPVLGVLTTVAGTLVAPHKASLRNLAAMPLTVLGYASIDFAAFHLAHGWGWLVTGLSLILLEHQIADEDGAA